MRLTQSGDPRLEALIGANEPRNFGVRPVIRLPKSGPSPWLIAGIVLIGALLLFWVLDSRRNAQPQASVGERRADAGGYAVAPPPLYIPPAPPQPQVLPPQPQVLLPQRQKPAPAAVPPLISRASSVAPFDAAVPYYPQPPAVPRITEHLQNSRNGAGPVLVIDATTPGAAPANSGGATSLNGSAHASAVGRVRASELANGSLTVPQGVLIPAVLETGFDSNHAGFARAVVSRDVRGFDGTKVLIPRGSRVIGKYGSDVGDGQNRALISWTRLIRPDGVAIALDSPSVDPLGRGGVRARVNTHFWNRFGDALLRSTVDIGTGIARRAATGSIFVAVPGAGQNPVQQQARKPTLSVRPGTSISIFVARDLEFPVEASP